MTLLSNRKPGAPRPAPTEPFKRAVAGCMRALARRPELEIVYASRQAGALRRRARRACPSRRASPRPRRRGASRPCRFVGPPACLPRSRRAPAPRAARAGSARAVRRGRAGAGRGDRLAPHAGRRLEPHRDARGPLPPRQISRTSPTAPTRRSRTPSRMMVRERLDRASPRRPPRRSSSISGAPLSRRRPAPTLISSTA